MQTKIGIIGAGPSGLALSLFLKQKHEILEANSFVGGHAASFHEQGFTFDYGPHILFSKDQAILDFVITSLGENVSRCRRNNKISYQNKLIKYPFENDLHSLPLNDNYICLRDFLFNKYQMDTSPVENMKTWFLRTFGEGICQRYLFPYNEKVWNFPVEELSLELAERIPKPKPDDILKSALGYSTEGYLHQLYYHYPKRGGYQAIFQAWKSVCPIQYNYSVEKIEKTPEGYFKLSAQDRPTRIYQNLVTTMPIHQLANCLAWDLPVDIQDALDELVINPILIASFGIIGEDPDQLTAVYFPESDFWVNRISYPCTFSPENGPKGYFSLQAEITCKQNSNIWQQSDEAVLTHVRHGLQSRGLLPPNERICLQRLDRQPQAYVVYRLGYEALIAKVRAWFANHGIYLLGRFGNFEYLNVDMAIDRALSLAYCLNQDASLGSGDWRREYLNLALMRLGVN
jgi:protoporphyrinogen oxidase